MSPHHLDVAAVDAICVCNLYEIMRCTGSLRDVRMLLATAFLVQETGRKHDENIMLFLSECHIVA